MTTTTEHDPKQIEEAKAKLDDPMWRLSNLYKIVTKGDDQDDDDGLVVQFRPNRAQRRLLARLWHRNIILKARQLGFTTLVCMLWLDTALFSKTPIRCGIIAQDKEAAESIFRGKVKFAYDNLPDWLRERMPLSKATSTELEFGHNSASIRVATSMRSGTIHRLLVSEFGKISAKYPDKAKEVVTGSIPAVPKSGVLVIESTAEGQDGHFYAMTKRAQAQHEKGVQLTEKDYKFHFYPWWDAPEYTLDEDAGEVVISEALRRYFHELRSKISRDLTEGQMRWYAATLANDFSGEQPLMWQEYPSFPDEAFQVSTEGCWYANQLATARKHGRVLASLPVESAPVNTFWDIGRGDMTAIWLHQRIGPENRIIGYYENTGEDLVHYTKWLQDTANERGLVYGTHYLPHEAAHRRMGESRDTNKTIKEMLESLLPGHRFHVVPRVTTLNAGIQATRSVFGSFWFDETHCAQGLARLSNYRKRWDKANGRFTDEEQDDDNCHGADALRQLGQEAAAGNTFKHGGVRSTTGGHAGGKKWRTGGGRSSGMAV